MAPIKHILAFALLWLIYSPNAVSQSISDTLEQKILNAQSEGRIVDNLNNSFAQHPKGEFLLAPQNKDLKFGILIYNIDVYPDKAIFSAGIAFRDPKSNQLIAFRADNISFSNSFGLTGPVKLFLVKDVSMAMGQAAAIIIQSGNNDTYAVFDCKGLQEFGITGLINFNSEYLLPVNSKGETLPNQKLTASFNLKAKSWSNMVVQITLQPFQIKGLKNYIFNINQAIMDLSEEINATEMKFPAVYKTSDILGNHFNSWEGFYLQKGSVTFPEHFQSNTKKKIEIGITDLLIDEFGFSGTIFGTNLLDFEKGHIANWKFSINKAEINLVMNEIVCGKLSGDLGMPVLPDTTKLKYTAYVGINDNYGMQVSLGNNLIIPALKIAKVVLNKNSYVDITIKEGEINLDAELNGEFYIENKGKDSSEGPKFSFPSIAFQGFRVSNKDPKIDIEYLGLKNTNNPSNFSKYPLNINEIYLQKYGTEKRIGIRFGLNLMEKLSVKASISIVAEEQAESFKFKRLDIQAIEVKSVTSCFTLEGRIYFIKEDPDYGNGFSGTIKFTIDKPKIEAAASVLFGSINSHRYWYFDASVVWDKPGIPFFTGAEINGFLGGAWHGMREVNENDRIKNPQYGLTSIGKQYVPDKKAGLGLRAGVYIRSTGGSGSSSPFLAKVALEIQFNTNNGLNKLSLFGNIDVMTENNKTNKSDLKQSTSNIPNGNAWKSYQSNYKPQGKIGGPFMLEFDFSNKIYQSNFAIYLQGIADNKIVGIGDKGLAGEVSVYFSSSKWYFWIGTPAQPIGVKINLGSNGNVAVSAYFMAGKDVKPAEPLPKEITNILGDKNAGEMRKLNEMASGNAFAFGSRLSLQIGSSGGENNVSIYASLKAIIGFDINVANYGNNNSCSSHTGPPGINGWFANGQLFMYLQGTVGATYKLGKLSGKVDLLTLTCAAQLYCQGPNPFYSRGSAAIQVNIAGVINKSLNLNFEIGEQCEMQKRRFTDTILILETHPINGENKLSTLIPIDTKFSVPIEVPFTDIEGKQIVFRLLKYEVSENNRLLKGNITWNKDKTKLSFAPDNLLPGNKKIKISIQVEAGVLNTNFEILNANGTKSKIAKSENTSDRMKYNAAIEKMKQANLKEMDYGNGMKIRRNDWVETVVLNGNKVNETKEVFFTTAGNPSQIAENNIELAYPVQNQMNYYKSHSNKGYIQLKIGQDYLINVAGSKIMALFVNNKGIVFHESKVSIQGKKLQYTIPNQTIKNNENYQLIIKRTAENAASEIGRNVNIINSRINNLSIASNPINVVSNPSVEKNSALELDLLLYNFSTSHYNSLSDKLANFAIKDCIIDKENRMELKIANNQLEYFDFVELKNKNESKPLIKIELDLNSSSWSINQAKNIYKIFNSYDEEILKNIEIKRDTGIYGLIPKTAITMTENNIEKMFLRYSNQSIIKPEYTDKEILVESNFYEIAKSDLEEIKNGLTRYVSMASKLNVIELNRYFQLFNNKTRNYETGIINNPTKIDVRNIPTKTIEMSCASLNIQGSLANNASTNTSLPNNNNQNNSWLVKISKLELPMIDESTDYPIIFHYLLPGELIPISSIKLKTSKVNE